MLSMLDRHAVQELLRAGVPLGAIARQFGVSRRTIRRIRREAPITSPVPRTKRPGRPGVRIATRERLRALLIGEPEEVGRPDLRELLTLGVSPRSYQHVLALTRVTAFLHGRSYALPQDVKAIYCDASRHRIARTRHRNSSAGRMQENSQGIADERVIGAGRS